jgi:bifunctional enzyme CysN/CysC
MVTGASTAELALILVDARKGVVEQTRRHSALTHLLGIRHLVLCVNKMDLVDWSEARFREIEADYAALAQRLGIEHVTVIPMAAVTGENIVDRDGHMPWYDGPSLLEFLETVEVPDRARHAALRFPVQYVIRPHTNEFPDYRGYAGTVAAGRVEPGMDVTVLPINARSQVVAVDRFCDQTGAAESGDAVTIRLADDLDVSRGYMIVESADPAPIANRFTADICWMSDTHALRPRQQFWIKHTTRRVRCLVESLDDRLDIHTLGRKNGQESFALNDIGRVTIKTLEPLFLDPYETSRDTGSFILIDPATRLTVAAGMVRDVQLEESVGAAG